MQLRLILILISAVWVAQTKPLERQSRKMRLLMKVVVLIKQLTVLIMVIAMINMGLGCTHITKRPVDEIPVTGTIKSDISGKIEGIHSLKLKSGSRIRFELPGGVLEANSTVVVGLVKSYRKENRKLVGKRVEFELEQTRYLYFKEPYPLLTALAVTGVVAAAVGIFALIQMSSHDNIGFGSAN